MGKVLTSYLAFISFRQNFRFWRFDCVSRWDRNPLEDPFQLQMVRCMTFADCRLQTGDWRLQTADCKLNDTENPPYKGDVFKNIKSCESSLGNKVDIFVQSYIGLIPKMLLAILHRPFIISPGISLIALILHSSLIIVN